MIVHASARGIQRGELARRSGCSSETVRHYEKIGLLPEPPRTQSGYRIYDATHERRLRFILRARELGFSIEESRGLLGLAGGDPCTCAEVRDLTLHHLGDVRSKIRDLRRLERTLAGTVAACSGNAVPDCPVIDSLNGE